MIRSRRVAGFVAAVSLAVLLVSVGVMARRIDWYQKTQAAPLFSFAPVETRRFEFAGKPVTIADEPMPEGAGGEGVVVRYGDDALRLPATVAPGSPQLPGLARHRDWVQVLRFAERGRLSYEEFKAEVAAGRIKDRLAVVVRVPPPGEEGGRPGPGEVFRKEWVFDLYELRPEGGFAHERLGFPRWRKPRQGAITGISVARRTHITSVGHGLETGREITIAGSNSTPAINTSGTALTVTVLDKDHFTVAMNVTVSGNAGTWMTTPELVEGTWEFYAALMVMPSLGRPSPRFSADALPALGWTLPAAAFSGLVLTWAFASLVAPRRVGAPA